jgi:anaerobic selenocysteine-containing dehydrogenase
MAAARADVPVEQIELAAKWLGAAQRPIAGSGTGPSMATHSNTADHMIEVVNVLAGGYRRAGDRVRNPGTLKVKDAFEMAVSPTRSFECEPKCLSEDTGLLVGEFPTALIPREIAADSPDRIRALICFGGDPLKAMGDPALASQGFGKLDLLVSLDSRMNATADLADYVIATSQPFERHEISVPGDSSYPEPFVQYARPVVAKPEGVIDDWEFFWGVSARMGVPLTFKYWNYGLRFEDIPGGLPLSLTEKPDPEDLCRFLAADSAVPFDDIKASPAGVRPDLEPRFVRPGPPDAPGRLELCPPDVAAELAAVAAEEPEPSSGYRLTCRRILHALNSAYRDSAEVRRRFPVNYAHMNPDDMRIDGIEDGDRIEIASEFGSIRTLAKAEARLRRGVVSMTHMFGPLVGSGDPAADGGASVGELVSLTRHVQPINFMPRFSAIPINVKKVNKLEPV